MELVGRVTRTQTATSGLIQAEFRCTNKEVFSFIVPPVLSNLPEDELIRCFTHRLGNNEGQPREHILNHWEPLS